MKFYNEHVGYIEETTTIEFDLPRYVGCITTQIYVTNFDGELTITYIDKSATERKSTMVLPIMSAETKSFIFSSVEQMSKIKFKVVFPEDAKGSIDKIAVLV